MLNLRRRNRRRRRKQEHTIEVNLCFFDWHPVFIYHLHHLMMISLTVSCVCCCLVKYYFALNCYRHCHLTVISIWSSNWNDVSDQPMIYSIYYNCNCIRSRQFFHRVSMISMSDGRHHHFGSLNVNSSYDLDCDVANNNLNLMNVNVNANANAIEYDCVADSFCKMAKFCVY